MSSSTVVYIIEGYMSEPSGYWSYPNETVCQLFRGVGRVAEQCLVQALNMVSRHGDVYGLCFLNIFKPRYIPQLRTLAEVTRDEIMNTHAYLSKGIDVKTVGSRHPAFKKLLWFDIIPMSTIYIIFIW